MSETPKDKRESFRDLLKQKARQLQQRAEPARATETAPDDLAKFAQFDQFPGMLGLDAQKQALAQLGIRNPFFHPTEAATTNIARIDGRDLISYSGYNYLGLSGDPRVTAAAQEAVARYGTSVSASRMVTGEKPLHRELESELAHMLGTEDAVVLVSGHATNVTVLGHLFGPRDLILYDALSHNSVLQGCILSGARHMPFAHNDPEALEELLRSSRRQFERVLIVIEGVYSMDGDIADLPAFVRLKRQYHAFLMVDEAHSLGVIGATGRGIGEHAHVERRDVDLWMGTLSKSLASCGGYIAGRADLVDYLRYTTPGFLYSVGISPANAAAALAACRIMQAEPERVQRLQRRAHHFRELARQHHMNIGLSAGTAVIPVIVGDSMRTMRLANRLFDQGVNVHPILPPAVPEHATRLRFFVTSEHSEEQLTATINIVAEALAELAADAHTAPAPDHSL